MKQLLLVFVGGGYLNNPQDGIPYGTFAVNILGSLLIGIILGLAAKNDTLTSNQTLLLATGFCGGFTTFSSFAYENYVFLKTGDFTSFALYTIASFIIGFLAVFFGLFLVKSF